MAVTCSSLSPKSVYSLFRFVASSSSSFSSPNFSKCSSTEESALVYTDYLRSHFFVSQPKTLHSPVRDYLSELRRVTCPQESHCSFWSPFSSTEFLMAAANVFLPTATGPDKIAYSMLKHFPRSGMDFLCHIFNHSWSLHSFPSIWETFSIFPIYKMEKSLDSPASFRPFFLILSCVLFFLESSFVFSPRQASL